MVPLGSIMVNLCLKLRKTVILCSGPSFSETVNVSCVHDGAKGVRLGTKKGQY